MDAVGQCFGKPKNKCKSHDHLKKSANMDNIVQAVTGVVARGRKWVSITLFWKDFSFCTCQDQDTHINSQLYLIYFSTCRVTRGQTICETWHGLIFFCTFVLNHKTYKSKILYLITTIANLGNPFNSSLCVFPL